MTALCEASKEPNGRKNQHRESMGYIDFIQKQQSQSKGHRGVSPPSLVIPSSSSLYTDQPSSVLRRGPEPLESLKRSSVSLESFSDLDGLIFDLSLPLVCFMRFGADTMEEEGSTIVSGTRFFGGGSWLSLVESVVWSLRRFLLFFMVDEDDEEVAGRLGLAFAAKISSISDTGIDGGG